MDNNEKEQKKLDVLLAVDRLSNDGGQIDNTAADNDGVKKMLNILLSNNE